jgi:hypothetical protein
MTLWGETSPSLIQECGVSILTLGVKMVSEPALEYRDASFEEEMEDRSEKL